jgi:thiamine-monophosphate kinase
LANNRECKIVSLQELGEFGFIRCMAQKLQTRRGVRLGIGDDAAILETLQTPVATCDALIENVHFRREWTTPFLLGRKAMNVNVSDLAAKGARPVAAFVTLGISEKFLREELPNADRAATWLENVYEGFEDAAREFDFTIAGGDTTRTQSEVMISVTLLGEAGNRLPVLRSGAQIGDIVLTTGTLGDSAAGLFLLQNPQIEVSKATRDFVLARHFDPAPRLREMQALIGAGSTPDIHAALDLSDGVAGDAAHIARASQVQIEIDVAALPISSACREVAKASDVENASQTWALSGGEDYELLLCAAPEKVASLSQALMRFGSTPVTAIGRCAAIKESSAAAAVLVFSDGRREIPRAAWTHF